MLNEHGIVTTYDEVMRFRKSAAKYISVNGGNVHEAIGLMRRVGPMFGWFDNFDLLVCTPNGRRETHAMAIEFQQHPSGVLECGSAKAGLLNLTIPRLCKGEVASLWFGSKSVVMARYTGPKKVNHSLVACRPGPPFTDVCALQGGLERAQVVDTQWLNSLLHEPSPIEWGGYNAALAKVECSPKPPTTYIFGPLIDAPPSHPDTVLTTLSYFEKTLTELGMKTSNLSADMQLYIVATLIKWASHGNRFKSVILRPGGMHTLMSFIVLET